MLVVEFYTAMLSVVVRDANKLTVVASLEQANYAGYVSNYITS